MLGCLRVPRGGPLEVGLHNGCGHIEISHTVVLVLQIASDSLKGRVFEVSLADLQQVRSPEEFFAAAPPLLYGLTRSTDILFFSVYWPPLACLMSLDDASCPSSPLRIPCPWPSWATPSSSLESLSIYLFGRIPEWVGVCACVCLRAPFYFFNISLVNIAGAEPACPGC